MSRRNKIVYTLTLSAFVLKIGMELIFRNGDIVWPAIGMMWCYDSFRRELKN
jgi:hypothetical protein